MELEAIPHFVVIGAMRAGTTTLHELLNATGCVSLSNMKEIDYFITEDRYARGLDWFRSRFGSFSEPIGDISPNYAKRDEFSSVPDRIHETNPNAKLIYIVRDPVERAISQFRVARMTDDRLKLGEFSPDRGQGYYITRASQYAYQLEPYLKFWSLEDILVLDFEVLKTDPNQILSEVFEFIGLNPPEDVIKPAHTNATTDVNKLPEWWLNFRKTKIGETIRTATPRPIASRLKSTLKVDRSNSEMDIPDQTFRRIIGDAVAVDAAAFRSLTGRKFDHWTV